MKIQRTLPPAASPIYLKDILHGFLGMIRGNSEIERFRNELKHHFNVKHCFLVSSGKTALYCILKALHEIHPDKEEVLIPAFNCYSVPSAIVYAGLKVRLCDVNQETLDFDFNELGRELEHSDRLLCVIPTHMFGIPADVARVNNMTKNRFIIVEDAAQAFGGSNDGKLLGLSGDVGFFSLGRGKAFSCVEGGIIVTDNDEIGKRLALIVDALPEYPTFQVLQLLIKAIILVFFSHPLLFWLPKGLPFLGIGETVFERSFPLRKLGVFQIGLTRNWQRKLEYLLAQRRKNTEYWVSFLKTTPLPGIVSLINSSGVLANLLRFPIQIFDVQKRNLLLQKSEEQGLGISITYPQSLDKLQELKNLVTAEFPQAAHCAATIVTLPIHGFLQKNDLKKIGNLLKSTTEAYQ